MTMLILVNNGACLYKFCKERLDALYARKDEVYISFPNGDFIAENAADGQSFYRNRNCGI